MKLTKTTALKASLLLVLAANMSWEKIEFGSAQLAQTGTPSSDAVKAGAAPGASAGVPTSTSPAALSVSMQAPAAQAPKLSPPSHTSANHLLVCGEKYEVHYQQFDDTNGVSKTNVSASRLTNREDGIEIVVRAKMLDLIGAQENTYARLTREIKAMRTEKKQACPGETVAAVTAVAATETNSEDAKQRAEDVKNCKTDAKGVALKSEKYKSCLIRELGRIDKRIDQKDDEGKRRSERDIARSAVREIESLAGKLKAEIRKGMLSKKEMDIEDAERSVDDAIQAIESAAEAYSDDDEVKGFDKTIARIVGELQALKKASETRREAADLKEKATDAKASLRTTRAQALAEPLNPQAIADYNQSVTEFNLLRQTVYKEFEQDELLGLQGYKRRNLISNADYVDFVKPYTELQRLLREALATPSTVSATHTFSGPITGSVMGDDYKPAANLADVRSARTVDTRSALGLTLPTARPTVQPNLTLQAPRSTFGN